MNAYFDPFDWLERNAPAAPGGATSTNGRTGNPAGPVSPGPAPLRIKETAGEPEWTVSPGDDYNARMTWDDLLTRHGWVKYGAVSADGVQQWTRPGKQDGCSATTGHCGDKLHVFSSSIPEFEANGTYDLFGAFVRLEGGGDFTAATHALIAGGYGVKANPQNGYQHPGAYANPANQTERSSDVQDRIDQLTASAETIVKAARIENLYRDHEFLANLARLEVQDPPEAEAIKATVARIDGFRQRAFNLALAPFRQEQAANPPEGPEDSADHEFTDLGNGRRLVDLHGHRIRYCKPYADWLIYDGRRWSRDDRYEIESMAQQVPAQILTEIPPTRNEETITAYKKWAFLSQAKDRLLATINLARSMVSVTPNDLDRDPWLLNVQNGTIHLRTGQFLPHRPDDLITKIAQAVYDPAATAPHWERFLFEIMNGNESLVAYLRRAIGYSITGVIREHAFFFLYGVGRNGKTSLLNTLFTILGDYANQIDSDLLIAQNQTQHPTGLTELEGRRMVSADESDDGRRFAEAQVKRLTGGNMIQARRMNQNFYTFRPSHHLFFAANHKPEIRGMDPGIWRRIKMIPFEVSFDPALPNGRVPDLDLEDKLLRESSGILNWMLRGCREWQEFGLAEPAVVSSVVSSYQQEMDMLGWFLEERCYAEEGERAVLSVLFGEYLAWCRMTNILHPLSIRKFSNQLSDKGFTTKKSNSVVYKFGIRMKTEVERDIEGNSVDQEEGDFDWTTGRYSAQVPK